jgi:acylphosphatase
MGVRAHVNVYGRVQGVFFRHSTRQKALSTGVNGWVRNLGDGSVEAVFEGEEAAVQHMVDWCRVGPDGSGVEDVKVGWGEKYEGVEGFTVRY